MAAASNIPSHPPPFWASLITKISLTHHSPRSQPQLRTMFVYYALLLTLTPTASLAANPARMSSSWVRLMSPVHRFVTCPLPQEEIQRVKIFRWLYANNLYWIRQVRERGNMPNKCKRAESLPRCEKENFFFRFSAKITTQVLRQEESGSISPNDAAVELYEGEIYIHQHSHCQASNSREVLGSVVIRF